MNMQEEFLDHEPMSEEDALGLLQDGEYKSYIRSIDIKSCGPNSKNPGKKYFMATVDITDGNGRNHTIYANCIFDYLLKHLYDSTGNQEKYKNKRLSTKDCQDKWVISKVKFKKGDDKYPKSKNEIIDFLPLKEIENSNFDDPIPF